MLTRLFLLLFMLPAVMRMSPIVQQATSVASKHCSHLFLPKSPSLYTMMTLLLPDEGYYAGANLGWLDVRSLRHVAFLPPYLCTTCIHLILAVLRLCFCRGKSLIKCVLCTFCQKYFTWFWWLVHHQCWSRVALSYYLEFTVGRLVKNEALKKIVESLQKELASKITYTHPLFVESTRVHRYGKVRLPNDGTC